MDEEEIKKAAKTVIPFEEKGIIAHAWDMPKDFGFVYKVGEQWLHLENISGNKQKPIIKIKPLSEENAKAAQGNST